MVNLNFALRQFSASRLRSASGCAFATCLPCAGQSFVWVRGTPLLEGGNHGLKLIIPMAIA